MINHKLSRELQDAGLKWEPTKGDWFYWENRGKWNLDVLPARDIDTEFLDNIDVYGHVYCPRLDQLLQEIEARGYEWTVVSPYKRNPVYGIAVYYHGCVADGLRKAFEAATPEEAAAQALLWILWKEAKSG